MKIDAHKISLVMAREKLTQAALAQKCGLTRQTICTILSRGTCSVINAGRIATGLRVDVAEIVRGD